MNRFLGQIKSRLFWQLALVYTALLLAAVAAVDIYTVQALRSEYRLAALDQLESLDRLLSGNLPDTSDETGLQHFAVWIERAGVRCTIISLDGKVLADSDTLPSRMENHSSRPEFKEALAVGTGRAIRRSDTLGRDLVYLAVRHDRTRGGAVVVRFAIPLNRLDTALADFRWRLWLASLIILALAGGISMLWFHNLTARINRLKRFSRRVAAGDFRPLPADLRRDELADLTVALNETAAKLEINIADLTNEKNQSAAILRSMAEGVAVISVNQRLSFCNEAFLAALSIEKAWLDRPIAEVIPQVGLLNAAREVLSGSDTVRSELVVGTIRTKSFAVTAAPVRSSSSPAGAVMVLHDITELRRLERARRDFVANVSHEFRTPLTAIQGFADTLLGGALEDVQNRERFLEIIRSNAERLSRLTNDLLRLSQIEAGQLQLNFHSVSLPEIIDPCVENIRIQAEQKGILIDTECNESLPPVHGDCHALQEILQNILDNAVRYTPTGGKIQVRASRTPEFAVIRVEDTGIGIPKEHQGRIFERFYRADTARSRELGGTGLGLSIAKHLVEIHGGHIDVESEVGKGSTFSVYLPGSNSPVQN
jgi:two-component system, OmpR family, phosphate regulon sensor histidine kinase PhoR